MLYDNGKYPFIQTGDVARSQGSIRTYSNRYNDVGLAQSAMWSAGTLCITIAANIADSGILTFDACFPDSVVGLVVRDCFKSARFFEYFIRTAKDDLQEFAPSTLSIPSFNYQMTPKISLNTRCSISISENLPINGQTRSSDQLGIWSYNINP